MEELRKKMMEDMLLSGFAESTRKSYSWGVDGLAKWSGRSPAELSEEDLRQYFLYLVNDKKLSWSTVRQHLCGIKYLFEKTLGKQWGVFKIVRPKREKKLPVVLSREEVRTLLSMIDSLRYRTALTLIYSCGLRLNEGISLKTEDIDGDRRVLWVRSGKRNKDRSVPMAQSLVELSCHDPILSNYGVSGNPGPVQSTPSSHLGQRIPQRGRSAVATLPKAS